MKLNGLLKRTNIIIRKPIKAFSINKINANMNPNMCPNVMAERHLLPSGTSGT